MKSLATLIPWIFTGVVLTATAIFSSTIRLEYCGKPKALQPRSQVTGTAEAASPTLAPPAKVVFLCVEADQLDLQVDWLDN